MRLLWNMMKRAGIGATVAMAAGSFLLTPACSDPASAPPQRTYSFHMMSGVSMGAIGSAFFAGRQMNAGPAARQVDAIGALGGPLDVAYMLAAFERGPLGTHCTLAQLEQLMRDKGPRALDDPKAIDCGHPTPFAYEHQQDLRHWRFTENGGSFDRSSYLDIFTDLILGLGNPLVYNPSSPFFPVQGLDGRILDPAVCTQPKTRQGIFNREFNPRGEYPVVTLCDGEEAVLYCSDAARTPYDACTGKTAPEFCTALGAQVRAASDSDYPELYFSKKGEYDPCIQHVEPVGFAVAIDLNKNGRRDYHEPLLINGYERFRDVGVDGCANAFEDGKGGCLSAAQADASDRNGDDFGLSNGLGTEGNWIHEAGEPYDDDGLDGVPGTGDFGEANGSYDMSPTRRRWFDIDFRQSYVRQPESVRRSLDVYADGGVRDVFNLGLSGDVVFSAVQKLYPTRTGRYMDLLELPSIYGPWPSPFNALDVDWAGAGRNVFVRYGTTSPTEDQLRAGDGDHVGSVEQLVGRFGAFIKWTSEHWTPVLGEPSRVQAAGRRKVDVYYSEVLKAPRDFGIALPPGYDNPENADKRYPVVFLLHGYGMNTGGMTDLNLIFDSFIQQGEVREMILVYPSGQCCFKRADGSRDCRETNDDGVQLRTLPGYTRECRKGSFYVDRAGYIPGDDSPYAESLVELMDYVDRNYRVLAPQTVDLPQ